MKMESILQSMKAAAEITLSEVGIDTLRRK